MSYKSSMYINETNFSWVAFGTMADADRSGTADVDEENVNKMVTAHSYATSLDIMGLS